MSAESSSTIAPRFTHLCLDRKGDQCGCGEEGVKECDAHAVYVEFELWCYC